MGGMYGTYGGGYGGYSGYGGYGVGYSGYGGGSWDDTAMVRQAEERTRSTFQSVESVVGAFASVRAYLSSSYHHASTIVHRCFTSL